MIVKRTLQTVPYTLLCDTAETEDEKTVFYLKVLSARKVADLQDMVVDNKKPASFMNSVVLECLDGWDKFDVPFNKLDREANLDLLPTNVIMELAEKAMALNFPDYETQSKN